jgi:hypothetical protein
MFPRSVLLSDGLLRKFSVRCPQLYYSCTDFPMWKVRLLEVRRADMQMRREILSKVKIKAEVCCWGISLGFTFVL